MSGLEEAKRAITEVCEALKTSPAIGRAIDDLRDFLHGKQDKYNNSVFEPLRLFSRASVEDLIRVRLDDKVTRILRGQLAGEDSFDDFAGYLVLLRALPIYLQSMTRRYAEDDLSVKALTYNRLCDVAGIEAAERVFLATPEGGDVVEDMQRAIESAAKKPVPGHVVTQSLRDRGLRVGMTFEEVRANKWTECAAVTAEGPEPIAEWCSESDPCSACKFLDGVMCKCGHPLGLHHHAEAPHDCDACPVGHCANFTLASWTPDSDGLTYREEPPVVYKSVDAESQATPIYKIGEVADVSEPKKETDMTERTLLEESLADLQAQRDKRKPRIDRKTWHETDDGRSAIAHVIGALKDNAPTLRAWYSREIADATHLDRSAVDLALTRLIATGEVEQHGKAKGTRYAVAGFTDWPAPTPRKRASNEPPVSEADADAAHSLDASDSEET